MFYGYKLICFFVSFNAGTLKYSSNSSFISHLPPLNHIHVTPSLETTPTNTLKHTPITTPVKQPRLEILTIPKSDTDFDKTFLNITPTHYPPATLLRIPDPNDINPKLIRHSNKPFTVKPNLLLIKLVVDSHIDFSHPGPDPYSSLFLNLSNQLVKRYL